MEKKQTITADEQLFEAKRKKRKAKKRKLLTTVFTSLTVVIVLVIAGVNILKQEVREQVGGGAAEVLSAETTIGSISTTVSGSGSLTADDVESFDVPSSVEIIEYYVEAGDRVAEGDLIATVSNASVLTAMADLQKQLDELDEEIADASGDKVSSTITASTDGRVKLVNVEKEDSVASVMYEHGALMLLSLDGYMAVDIETENLHTGDEVSVVLSDGSVIEGTVKRQTGGTATVLVTDNGTVYGDMVTVQDANGTTYGTGALYIHSQMKVVGYAGTVSGVKVSENDKVSSGKTLISLTDTETSASYDALLKERAELEKQLQTLVRVYKDGAICSTIAGVVDSVEATTENDVTTVAKVSADTTMSISISVDETDILSLEAGQTAAVSIDSISEDSFAGTVSKVDKTATSSSGVTYYTAEVSVAKTEDMLSGMSASVAITIEGSENALLIPIDALHQTSSSAYVYTEYDEAAGEYGGMKEVTIGLSNSSYVEITSGLSEGDVVYYTEAEENAFGNMFGNMGGFGGDFGGGGMSMPEGGMSMPGGSDSSGRPNMGNMPGGGF